MTTPTMQMYDGAYPPAHPPAWPVVAGYLGGNTPHVWTRAEWEHQPARYRLPIWVRSNPGSVNAGEDAARAVSAAHAVGVPQHATIALDFETAVNAAYVHAFDKVLTAAGYRVVLYGSAVTVRNNPQPSGGYWVAHWTGTPHMDPGTGVVATQYTNGKQHPAYDSSLIAATVPLWDARPPAKPATPGTADDAAVKLARQVWMTDGVVPTPESWSPGNPHWAPGNLLTYCVTLLKQIQASIPKS